jgi:hypothetical protein
MEYMKDSNFTFENEKCLNEDLQNLVNGEQGTFNGSKKMFKLYKQTSSEMYCFNR